MIPLIFVGGGVGLQSIVARHIGASVQRENDATEKRTTFIASVFDSMKAIRMTGRH